jgi:glycosyltransferase involved in cell wall biosynthesis
MEGVCVSSKLYTALAAGMPILVIAQPEDDEARIVETFDAGINVPQNDVDSAVKAINRWTTDEDLVSQQANNAREAFESHFTKEHSLDRYYDLLADDQSIEPDPVTQRTATSSLADKKTSR